MEEICFDAQLNRHFMWPRKGHPFISNEPWSEELGWEVDELGKEYYSDPGKVIDPRRKYELDHDILGRLCQAGYMHIVGARETQHSPLLGAALWTTQYNIESKGTLIAGLTSWFIRPKAPRYAALDMWGFSISLLKALGVKCIFPQRSLVGNDCLRRFYARKGAKEVQAVHYLWIGSEKLHS